MKKIIKNILFVFILTIGIKGQIIGQIKDIGLPFISNYTRETYNAETQNWCITQDNNNVMYFANNIGVLSFDGNMWQLFPLPNNSIVRSVLFYDNKIYAGGYNEFGYFEKDAQGDLNYYSLSATLKKENNNFDEVWRIHATPDGIVFQSYLNIFIYKDAEFKILEPKSRFGFSYMVNSVLYVVDREFGIYSVQRGKLVPLFLNETLFLDNDVTFIIPGKRNELYIGTTNSGVFSYAFQELKPWKNEINNLFIKNQTYTGVELNNDQIAIGTIQNGIYIINKDGNIVQHLNRSRGLQNNTVLSLFFDHYKNLWLGLDNGIDMLEVNSPITLFNYSYDIETSYTSIIHNNILYIGTNQGLFAKKADAINNQFMINDRFDKIAGTLGQVWKLKMLDNKLWCGHNFGTFIIDKFQATPISQLPGGWDYVEVPWEEGTIIGGNYSGLELFRKKGSGQQWESEGAIKGIHESCRELVFDNDGFLWFTHGLKGVFRITLSGDLKRVTEFQQFDESNGLPKIPYSLVTIKQQFYLLANDSLFSYQTSSKKFEYNNQISSLFKGIKEISHLTVDTNGDIWFFTRTGMGVLRLMEDGTYIKITNPFMRVQKLFISGSFENVYNYGRNNTFIGSKEGMLHYSLDATKEHEIVYNTYISEIKTHTRSKEVDETKKQLLEERLPLKSQNLGISYKNNSISFKFYTPFYEATNQVKHSYRLIGFDEGWSEWSAINFKEYTNLKEGKYTFEVKAKNIYETESQVYKYPFVIKPPFYRSLIFYILYIIFLITLILVNLIYFKHKIETTRRIEKLKHSMELVSKEKKFKEEAKQSEEKIEQLEQEKLKSEMRHKNMELANSTMNLIQKNKLLNSLKKELLVVSEKAKSDQVKQDLKQITVRIDSTMKNDQNYKVFDKYFERVHQDFITRLKEKHPDLTPKDIRLCAYLRMNLSTKEIAPLINVSIRGLEISRYRLRKKLDLERDVNLIDYIMKV